ncbi:MAG TPA: 4-hydroxy-tetrahydrodipicolinate synthase [Xanthomonadales bacterium]|nr:4-hydroxy-tetrahydrodipicolinate synthase [Xanthomonadales bacterium]
MSSFDSVAHQQGPLVHSMSSAKFQGSICALVTPFTASGELDLPAFRRLLAWHAACGTQALVIGGSTGESVALEDAEFEQLVGVAAAEAAGVRIIAGCGAGSTRKSLRMVRRAAALGAEAALVVTPYYVRPTQEGLVRHYLSLADDGGLPLVPYNVPTRTGCDLQPETLARIARHERIVAIKEARAEPERMQALLPLRSDRFAVLSGDDPTALRAMRAGADGVISVANNVVPRAFRALCDAALSGKGDAAAAIDAELAPLYAFLGAEPNPIPVKWLVHALGRIGPALRLPLLELSAAHRGEADRCLALAGRVERARGEPATSAA